MKLEEIARELDLEVKACREMLSNEVTGGYVSDLLSDVTFNHHGSSPIVFVRRNLRAAASVRKDPTTRRARRAART